VGSEHLYVSNLELIEKVIAGVGRRQRLRGADLEDFASIARIHIIDNDYEVLRRFQGRSSLETYLAAVVTRRFQDWRNARWGKWRCSAVARRLGPLAERLERMLVRDRHTLDEAHQILTVNLGLSVSRQSLEAMAARFPARTKRTFVSDEAAAAAHLPAAGEAADDRLSERESAGAAQELTGMLSAALDTLSDDDRLLLRMRYWEDISVADISRMLHTDQMPLYRRLAAIRGRLLTRLVTNGVEPEAARSVLIEGGLRELEGLEPEKSRPEVRLDLTDAQARRQRERPR
jgi:RNA polymerase sigma factor (sigma-70 family)